jgi:NADH-quinone oxidoreductase subunit C
MPEELNKASKSAYDEGDHYVKVSWKQVPDPVTDSQEDAIVETIKKDYPQFVISHHRFRGDRTIVIKREGLLEIVKRLKDDEGFDFKVLTDLTAVDYLGKEPRFEVVYHFANWDKKLRLRLKVPVVENDAWVDSIAHLYESANWFEREAMEFFGIQFQGHPDPRHLFLYDEFQGHPLRKDYPFNKRQPLIKYREVGIERSHYPGERGGGTDAEM